MYGTPKPAGSKAAYPYRKKGGGLGIGIGHDNPKTASWMGSVSAAAADAMSDKVGLLEGPLELRVVFTVARPKGHFGTGKNAGKLKDSAPLFPAKKPDVLKLGRAVEDAMTGIVYRDDSQTVVVHLTKRWGTPEGAIITVWEAT